jgi:REP element-mobilizing transposase RayT
VERREIFGAEVDYQRFLDLLGVMAERFEVEVWSYVLMGNHYHLLVKTRKENLSQAIQWLGVAYASYFNRRHERSGHLFQGRFKNFVIEEESYLRQLILYVLRNPLRAKIVTRLADYPWSSYRCLAYGRNCLPWLQREAVLELFDGKPERLPRAIQEYSREEARFLENLRFGLVLGGEELPDWLRHAVTGQRHREKPQARAVGRQETVASVVQRVQRAVELSDEEVEELRRPIRRRSRPLRDVLIYLVWKSTDHRLESLSEFFHVGYTTISTARVRGEEYLKRNKGLRSKVQEIMEGVV